MYIKSKHVEKSYCDNYRLIYALDGKRYLSYKLNGKHKIIYKPIPAHIKGLYNSANWLGV